MDKSPDAFRTISEVADHLETPAHVLRFWESRFPQVRPVKRAGGRRYYRPGDVALLAGIKRLLHDDGMTIRGVQKILREQGIRHVAALGIGPVGDSALDSIAQAVEIPGDSARVIPIAPERRRDRPVQPELWAEPPVDAPEAPFIEAEEEVASAPLPFPPAVKAAPPAADDSQPAPIATRLRRADATRMAPHAARLIVLRDRMVVLRDRLAEAARHRVR